MAGHGGAVLCYVLTGTVVTSVISSLCEMTALIPVNAPIMEFPRRFLDRGVGFAIGWMYWLAWVVGAAGQILSASATIEFRYDDGKTNLNWDIGGYINNAIWISIFLFLIISINMLPVKVIFNTCPLIILAHNPQ
jgi:amino acid transporter